MKRSVIVDRDTEYSSKEIQGTQIAISECYKDIEVFSRFPDLGAFAVCPISYSVNQVIDIFGEAYINAFSCGGE